MGVVFWILIGYFCGKFFYNSIMENPNKSNPKTLLHLAPQMIFCNIFLLLIILLFSTPVSAQTVNVTAISTGETAPVLCGEPFTFLISYGWSGYGANGPDKIEIKDILPAHLNVLSAQNIYGTVAITGNQVDFIITSGINHPSGTSTVVVNASFNCDSS